MSTYTLKKHNDELILTDDLGTEYAVKHLLDLYPQSRVFAFEGNLGAGKTTFIRHLCEQMGTEDVVNSPTFAIVNVYTTPQYEIFHFDCYRLKNLREALDLGAEEYLYSDQYCFIEWPDIISPILPDNTVRVTITVNEDGTRTLIADNFDNSLY